MRKIKYEVVLCTYNGEDYIKEQLESIVFQSIPPERIIISDDSNNDRTLEVITAYLNSVAFDVEILLMKGPKKGVAANFLNALSYSSSELVFFSDQDDVWKIHKAESFIRTYLNTGGSGPRLLFSDALVVDEERRLMFDSFIEHQNLNIDIISDDSIQLENCIQGASLCINDALKNIAVTSLDSIDYSKIVMHDWFLALIAKYTGEIQFLNLKLIEYRQHHSNQVGCISFTESLLKAIRKPTLFFHNRLSVLEQRQQVLDYLRSKEYIHNSRFFSCDFGEVSKVKKLVYTILFLYVSMGA